MTRPTLAEAITIDEFWKNRPGQAVKISLSTFQGRNLIDVRTWNTVDGKLKPRVKGFAADTKHLARLTTALVKAEARARELHLIDDGAERRPTTPPLASSASRSSATIPVQVQEKKSEVRHSNE